MRLSRVLLVVFASNVGLLVIVGAFLALDRAELHWYSEQSNRPSLEEEMPDRVVSVVRRCEPRIMGNGQPANLAVFGGCAKASEFMKTNDRLEVTVRSGSGGSYIVTLPPNHPVHVGDNWP